MIVETTMWQVQCDRCGITYEWDCQIAWSKPKHAEQMALESEWIHIGGDHNVHSCPDCWMWDKEEEDQIFKPGIIIKINKD